jgi:hypothetical protein
MIDQILRDDMQNNRKPAAILGLVLQIILFSGYATLHAEETTATMVVTSTSFSPMHVYVNGTKLGTVRLSGEIKFTPAKDGKNVVFVEFDNIFDNNRTSPFDFEAGVGAKVVVACTNREGVIGTRILVRVPEKGTIGSTPTTTPPEKTSTLGKVTSDEKKVEKEGRVDIVESEVGGETTYSETRTIKREVSYSVKLGLGTETEAKIGANLLAVNAELIGRVKASVEAERSEKWSDEITKSVTHKINLDKSPKVKVIWMDIYRTGTVEVLLDGKTHVVPFEFPVATRTVIKAVK